MTGAHARREKTIAANGDIITKPYGPSRWATPRIRPCAHTDCPNAATITARTGAHPITDTGSTAAHNCCGTHQTT